MGKITENIKKSFRNKSFKYGSFSALMTVLVVAILITINLVATSLDIKYDLSPEKLYSLSDETIEIIKNLDEEVTIYPLFVSGQEDVIFEELLNQYPKYSSKIKLEPKDPNVNPAFLEQYKERDSYLSANSIIVESGKRFKVIGANELVTYGYTEDYQQYPQSVDIEPKVTNAIQYVLADSVQKAYGLEGHNEMEMPVNYETYLDEAGITYDTINLKTVEEVPADASTLVMFTPSVDYTADEIAKLEKYMAAGGNLFVLADVRIKEFKNINVFLKDYGIEITDGYIFEQDPERVIQQDQRAFYSVPGNHEALELFSSTGGTYPGPFIYSATAIDTLEERRSELKITSLASSSAQSFAKNNPESETLTKEAGDADGPFDVAVAIEDGKSRVIVMSTMVLLDESIDATFMQGMNSYYFVEFAKWTAGAEESTFIPSKTLDNTDTFAATQGEALTMTIASIFVIPGIVLAAGLIVWLRRRNK